MDLADEPKRERQAIQLPKPMVQRRDVVEDLVGVVGPRGVEEASLHLEHVAERCLGAFDLGGEDGLLAHVHEHEEFGVGQRLDGAVELAEQAVRARQERPHLVVEGDGGLGREVEGHERRVAFELPCDLAGLPPYRLGVRVSHDHPNLSTGRPSLP